MAGLLDILIRATRAVRVLEIGTGAGASGLEIAAALPPDGRLITVERDIDAAMQARTAFASAGLDRCVTVMIGNADRYLHKMAGPFDLILQDSDATMYASMHDRLVPLLRPAGTLVTRHIDAAGDYNEVLAADARLTTAILHLDEDLAISVKRLDLT
ncbi:MAG TPA: class I SAM-dependent methyltransferase [Vicinamibacterales bacterium]|nr:class I SAM-dependent methyltransferase [Vicinamibacterales bacterium]